jgi:hypothetical protein
MSTFSLESFATNSIAQNVTTKEGRNLLLERRIIWAPILGALLGMILLYISSWGVYTLLRRLRVIRHPRPVNFEPFKEKKPRKSKRRVRFALGSIRNFWFPKSNFSEEIYSSPRKSTKQSSAILKQEIGNKSTKSLSEDSHSMATDIHQRINMVMSFRSNYRHDRKNQFRKNYHHHCHHKWQGRNRNRSFREHEMRMSELMQRSHYDDLDHSSDSDYYDYSESKSNKSGRNKTKDEEQTHNKKKAAMFAAFSQFPKKARAPPCSSYWQRREVYCGTQSW